MHGRALILIVVLVAGAAAAPARADDDGGDTPVGLVWSAPDAARTPATITPGATPAEQRVVYGVADISGARVVVRTLEKPGDVVPAQTAGTVIDDLGTDPGAFGTDGAVAPVAGPFPWVYAVHNDNGRIEIARIDAIVGTGDAAREEAEYTLEGSAGCRVEATPAYAAFQLLFTTAGTGCEAAWRIPVDETGALGAAERIDLPGVDALAPPAADLEHVFVPAGNALHALPIYGPLGLQGQLGFPGERPRGAVDTLTGVLHVPAAVDGGGTRLHRFDERRTASAAFAGTPAPGPVAPAGRHAVVNTTDGAFLVGEEARRLAEGAYGRTGPAASGDLAYLVSDAGVQSVIRLSAGQPVPLPDFAPGAPGAAFGSPALDRGYVVFATAGGVSVYRSRDVRAPQIWLDYRKRAFTALTDDARGVEKAELRLIRGRRVPRVVATRDAPEERSTFEERVFRFERPDVEPGLYAADVLATDPTGNVGRSGRASVVIGRSGLRAGACANRLAGSELGDGLRGSRRGDRITGGKGADEIEGGKGRDCISGGPGRDSITCGPGRDRVRAGRGDVIDEDCERVRRRGR